MEKVEFQDHFDEGIILALISCINFLFGWYLTVLFENIFVSFGFTSLNFKSVNVDLISCSSIDGRLPGFKRW